MFREIEKEIAQRMNEVSMLVDEARKSKNMESYKYYSGVYAGLTTSLQLMK